MRPGIPPERVDCRSRAHSLRPDRLPEKIGFLELEMEPPGRGTGLSLEKADFRVLSSRVFDSRVRWAGFLAAELLAV